MFLALAKKARECGIAICALHTGRGVRSQIASLSHTGAIAGDQDVLRAVVGREGVLFIDSLDELVDTVGLWPRPRCEPKRVGFMTDSGAAKTFAIDFSEEIGLDLPELSTTSLQRLTRSFPRLPRRAIPSTSPRWGSTTRACTHASLRFSSTTKTWNRDRVRHARLAPPRC